MSEIHDSELSPAQAPHSRRALLAGVGVTCAAALTGCTTYNANNGGIAGPPPSSSAPATTAASPAASGAATASGAAPASAAAPANALTSTSNVPVGGGTIIAGKNIVVTQPVAGTFKGFSAVCTHQGCIVDAVANGTIDCPCHGSKFSVKDGSVVNGPASQPLPSVTVHVDGTSVVQG
jgi:Rieske Fe-S protein